MNLNIKDGMRCSPLSAYLRPVMRDHNLTVLTEAPAVRALAACLSLKATDCDMTRTRGEG